MDDIARITGIAAPLPLANLDTDQIMPKQFLHGVDKSGLADGVLHDLRFHADGTPRADFVLNRPGYAATRVLVAGPNFGCGSSREHAVWGLQQFGVRAVVAPSFGEIFRFNARNNGLLALALPAADVASLLEELRRAAAPVVVDIDLAAQVLATPAQRVAFALGARERRMVVEGLDVVGLTLAGASRIAAFEAARRTAEPWTADLGARTRARLDAR